MRIPDTICTINSILCHRHYVKEYNVIMCEMSNTICKYLNCHGSNLCSSFPRADHEMFEVNNPSTLCEFLITYGIYR